MDRDDRAINRAVEIAREAGIKPGAKFDLATSIAEEMFLDGFSDDEVRAELARRHLLGRRHLFGRRHTDDSRVFFDSSKQAFLHLAGAIAWLGCGAVWLTIAVVPDTRTSGWPVPAFFFGVIAPVWIASLIAAGRIYKRVTGTLRGFMTSWRWQRQCPVVKPLTQAVRMLGASGTAMAFLLGAGTPIFAAGLMLALA
jgi:hypothetical protein